MGQAVGSILSRFYCSGTSSALLTINASRALLTVIPFRSSSSLTEGGYDQLTRDLTGEDTHSYKLRRFFFACSRVQTLYANWQSLTPAVSAFFMQHLPFGSEHLFPALKMIYWIEKDRNEPKISLRSSPIELPAFQTFRPAAMRFLDFELQDKSERFTSVLREGNTAHRLWEFIALLRQRFPNFYMANICLCRPEFCTHQTSRTILDNLNTAVLSAWFMPLSIDFT